MYDCPYITHQADFALAFSLAISGNDGIFNRNLKNKNQ